MESGEKAMRDTIIEDFLQETLKEHLHHRARRDPVVPSASRYPRTAKRAELVRDRQPWSQQLRVGDAPRTSQRFYS
jgi:hypothetical protein